MFGPDPSWKLVRDRIPELFPTAQYPTNIYKKVVDKQELLLYALLKREEELNEAYHAYVSLKPQNIILEQEFIQEMADVFEVRNLLLTLYKDVSNDMYYENLLATCRDLHIETGSIHNVQEAKRLARGAFQQGYLLKMIK